MLTVLVNSIFKVLDYPIILIELNWKTYPELLIIQMTASNFPTAYYPPALRFILVDVVCCSFTAWGGGPRKYATVRNNALRSVH